MALAPEFDRLMREKKCFASAVKKEKQKQENKGLGCEV